MFDCVDPAALALLREDRRLGSHRLLAVSLRREQLTNAAVWQLIEAGASDVFAWDDLGQPAAAVAARLQRYAEVDALLSSPTVKENLAGHSPTWLSVLRQVIETARFTDASMLLTGESGTGKELAARLIHELDPRCTKGKLVVLDCTTVVPELSGSEFFGHERGAFTHAVTARDGAFALADGGTLFLDEVGELPLPLQAELLRVVQERTYKRVGSNTWRQVNFRLICATNRDLLAEQAQGRFRRDLYFRIATWTCKLPPLRYRQEDILPLAQHFLKKVLGPERRLEFDPAVREYLLLREYPGNVRELRQLIHRVAWRHVGDGLITVGDLPEEELRPACTQMQQDWRDGELQRAVRRALLQGLGLRELTAQAAETAIQIALQEEGNSVHRAALRLRVTDRALQMRRAVGNRRETSQGSPP
ncbi:MAG TPA: sigma 54-interacting transcriptional regulator [Chthoniobacterales bacterium]|nr:sigma 54-interacting transcriptional regulator [Chthoniobacterales bacterium]